MKMSEEKAREVSEFFKKQKGVHFTEAFKQFPAEWTFDDLQKIIDKDKEQRHGL